MPSKPDSVTLYDVAHFAGVSHQTVSRVINKAAHVAAPTRLKVLKAISHLGYRPNPVARNLVTQRSGLIGVITFCQDSFGPSHLLISIDTVAMQRGYNTLLASVTEPSVDAIRRAAGDLAVNEERLRGGAQGLGARNGVVARHNSPKFDA